MNRSELTRAVASQLGIPKEAVELIVTALIETIEVSLACGEPVVIHRFGRFESRMKGATTRRNPRTGEDIMVPPKRAILFKPSPNLKERIQKFSG